MSLQQGWGWELPAVHSYVLCSCQEVEDQEEEQQAPNIWLPGENVLKFEFIFCSKVQ